MAIHGSLKTMPLADLLSWLKATERTGTLTVTRDGTEWELELTKGRVTGYLGPELREHLGQIVVTSGLITEDDLRIAIQHQRDTGVLLPKALVARGFLSEAQLTECLQQLAAEAIYDLFLEVPGNFVYSDESERGMAFELDEPSQRLPLDLEVNHLLMEGVRRQDEWEHIRERFPKDDVKVELVYERMPAMEQLGVRERRILASLAAGQTVSDICLELRAPVPSVLRTLAELEAGGAVHISQAEGKVAQAESGRLDRMVEQARFLFGAHQYDEAVSLLEAAVRVRPDAVAPREALREALEEQVRHLYDTLPPLKVPTIVASDERLQRLRLRPDERFLLERLAAHMDVGSLVMVSSMNERETLKTLRKLMHGGIIALR